MFGEWAKKFRIIICLWWGAMVASVGIVLFPQLADVSAFILYGQKGYNIEKTNYSYKPGQTGMYLTFTYLDKEDGKIVEKEANVLLIFLVCTAVYGSLTFILWTPVAFLLRKLKIIKESSFVQQKVVPRKKLLFLRILRSDYKEMKHMAIREGVPLGQFIRAAVRHYIDYHSKK
jgi:hypothetical protein